MHVFTTETNTLGGKYIIPLYVFDSFQFTVREVKI